MPFVYLVKFREVIIGKHLLGAPSSAPPFTVALYLSKRNGLGGLISQRTLAIIRAYELCHYRHSLVTIWRHMTRTSVTSAKVLMTSYDIDPYFKENLVFPSE